MTTHFLIWPVFLTNDISAILPWTIVVSHSVWIQGWVSSVCQSVRNTEWFHLDFERVKLALGGIEGSVDSIDWWPDEKGPLVAPLEMNQTPPCSQTPYIHRCPRGPCGSSSAAREGDSWSLSSACFYNIRHPALEPWHSYRAGAPQSCPPLHPSTRSSAHRGGLSKPACSCRASLCGSANACARQCARWSAGGRSSHWALGQCVAAGRSCEEEAEGEGGCPAEEAVAVGGVHWTPLEWSPNRGSPHGGMRQGCPALWDCCPLYCCRHSHPLHCWSYYCPQPCSLKGKEGRKCFQDLLKITEKDN